MTTDNVKALITTLEEAPEYQHHFIDGKGIYLDGGCQILGHGKHVFEVLVADGDDEYALSIVEEEGVITCYSDAKKTGWTAPAIAALFQVEEELNITGHVPVSEGISYTREGMVKRVLEERWAKAMKANYRIKFAKNIYGEHTLVTEKGERYLITLRDFENETGYIDNPDLKTNKLGTTKHLMFAFHQLKNDPALFKKLGKEYPFVEVYLDPLNSYQITWHYPAPLPPGIKELIDKYFGGQQFVPEAESKSFLPFISEAQAFAKLKVRPEVGEKIRKAWDQEMLDLARNTEKPDFNLLKTTLFPYQQEGVAFATFRDGAIIADEMGLGKTLQAMATAIMKKKIFGFRRTLIVCPASLKEQWKQEIEKFSDEQAEVVEGLPAQREAIYRHSEAYFLIVNYETVLRDLNAINRMDTDFIILDEAQKIKNFSTITAQNIKKLKRKHALVITGTPIENRLIDLYSIVQFIDPAFLAPLWEFSYQHCYFDNKKPDKITGYYNLQQLNERMGSILIRRTKAQVIKELPNITEINVPVDMHEEQRMYHKSYASDISLILRKKYISPYDMQKLMLLLNCMRMVCNSTYLIDKETHISPKLEELKYILLDKLDLLNTNNKVIIFSEWINMLNIIGKMLRENGLHYAQLTGKVAVKHRDKLIKKFEQDPNCRVFLSTESGGAGLNLQMADTVINFELPWNPAKKNQRLGRIDRIGQKSKNLTVINFITKNSIEVRISSGLGLKQNLFDGVLGHAGIGGLDSVDFSEQGRAQFLQQIEAMLNGMDAGDGSGQEESIDAETLSEDEALVLEEQAPVSDYRHENGGDSQPADGPPATTAQDSEDEAETEKMAKVMSQGMEFLASLMKMTTGKDLGLEGKTLEVDKATGEVVMRFKIPKA